MYPQDDYLCFGPVANEHKTPFRIALVALTGCMVLMFALVIQSHV